MTASLLIDDLTHTDVLDRELQQFGQTRLVPLVLKSVVADQHYRNLDFRWLTLFLPQDETPEIDRLSWDLARFWWRELGLHENSPLLNSGEIFWPDAIAIEFHTALLDFFKTAASLDLALDKIQPQSFTFITSRPTVKISAAALCRQRGIAYRCVDLPPVSISLKQRAKNIYNRLQSRASRIFENIVYARLGQRRKLLILTDDRHWSAIDELPPDCDLLLVSPFAARPRYNRKNGVHTVRLPHLDFSAARQEARRIRAGLDAIIARRAIGKITSYRGIAFEDYFVAALNNIIDNKLTSALAATATITRLADRFESTVYTGLADTTTLNRSIVQSMRHRGNPTVTIQHGYGCSFPSPVGYFSRETDYVAVWGDGGRRYYEQWGYPRENIVIVGHPIFTAYDKGRMRSRGKRYLAELGFDTNRPVVLWATHPADFHYTSIHLGQERLVDAVVEVAHKFPQIQWLVKPHPGDTDTSLDRRLAELGVEGKVLRQVELTPLLAACTALLVTRSTVALETMALDRPVIICNLGDVPDYVEFADKNAAPRADSVESLAELIEQIVINGKDDYGPARAEFVADYISQTSTPPRQRLFDFLAGL